MLASGAALVAGAAWGPRLGRASSLSGLLVGGAALVVGSVLLIGGDRQDAGSGAAKAALGLVLVLVFAIAFWANRTPPNLWLRGYPIDRDTGLPIIANPTDEARIKAIAAAAARKYAETGDYGTALIEVAAGIDASVAGMIQLQASRAESSLSDEQADGPSPSLPGRRRRDPWRRPSGPADRG